MEQQPASNQYPEIPEVDQWVGSPEHFEQAKANAASRTTNWSSIEEWKAQQGTAPWNDRRWQTPPTQSELEMFSDTAGALHSYIESDTPAKHARVSVSDKQLNPTTVGILAAVGFAAVEVLGIGGDPSDLVINHPEAAATMLAMGSALTGVIASKLVKDANADEQLRQAKHAKPNERSY